MLTTMAPSLMLPSRSALLIGLVHQLFQSFQAAMECAGEFRQSVVGPFEFGHDLVVR